MELRGRLKPTVLFNQLTSPPHQQSSRVQPPCRGPDHRVKAPLSLSLSLSVLQGIEQLKKEERRWTKRSRWMSLKLVFGHPFSISWLSPFSTPDHGKADVYQYIV